MTGIATHASRLGPWNAHRLARRIAVHDGAEEARFHLNDRCPILPVLLDGVWHFLPWGAPPNSQGLPTARLTWRASSDRWAELGGIEVFIPACAWFAGAVRHPCEDVRGVIVPYRGRWVAYLVVEPVGEVVVPALAPQFVASPKLVEKPDKWAIA